MADNLPDVGARSVAYLIGASPNRLALAKACFPELDWRNCPRNILGPRGRSASRSSDEIRPWLIGLTSRDIVALWQNTEADPAVINTSSARFFALEIAPFEEADSDLSLSTKCLRLRSLNGAVATELGPPGLPSFALSSPKKSRSGILVVGGADTLGEACEKFPNAILKALVPADATNDALVSAANRDIQLISVPQLPEEIGAAEAVVTDVLEIALAAQAVGTMTVVLGAAKERINWFGKVGANDQFDVGSYYGFVDTKRGASLDVNDVMQSWRITAGCARRAFLFTDAILLEQARACFPSLDWHSATPHSIPTSSDLIIFDEGTTPPNTRARPFWIGPGILAGHLNSPGVPLSLRLEPLHGGSVPELANQAEPAFGSIARKEIGDRSGILVCGSVDIVRIARARYDDVEIWAMPESSPSFSEQLMLNDLDAELVTQRDLPRLLERVSSVITKSKIIALAARSYGIHVHEDVTTHLTQSSSKSVDKRAATQTTYHGFASRDTLQTIAPDAALAAWLNSLQAQEIKESLVSPNFSNLQHIVIGQPGRAIEPFSRHFGDNAWQKPNAISVVELREAASRISGIQVSVYLQGADTVQWIREIGSACWVIDRAPIDYPLALSTSNSYIPAFHRLRVHVGEFGLEYALYKDIESWSPETRREYLEIGQRLRPLLRRLQTVRRMMRFNKVEMGRRFGPVGSQRTLVLGRNRGNPLLFNTNPSAITDLQIVGEALAARPDARVLYLPQKVTAQANETETKLLEAETKAIRALGPRVQVIDQPYCLNELVHVVSEVWTIDSPLGVMALASGLPVVVYGHPFYAGLGVTNDIEIGGDKRPPILSEPLDLETFLGWHFTANTLFADVLDGRPLGAESFVKNWAPYLGELSDDTSDRIVATAVSTQERLDDIRPYLRTLVAHGKNHHLGELIKQISNRSDIKAHPELSIDLAFDVARRGNWREGVDRIRELWNTHGKTSSKILIGALVSIRRVLRSPAEAQTFASYVLGTFRNLPSSSIKELGDAFAADGFYRTGMIFYASCLPGPTVDLARARGLIAIGDIAAASDLLTKLQRAKTDPVIIEDLELLIAQRKGHAGQAAAITILEKRVASAPGDFEQQMVLAKLYRDAGRLDDAVALFIRLIRSTTQSNAALRALAAIHVSRFDTSTARGLLESQLSRMPTDAAAMKLLAEVESFENNLPAAADQLLGVLRLSPLNIGAHTQLIEIEAEMGVLDDDGFGPWTRAFDTFLSEIDQPTVETLMSHGRSRLQVHDFECLKANCERMIKLFSQEPSAYCWYAHALAWEPCEKSPETLEIIRANYDSALTRNREDNEWTLLDAVRSAAHVGDMEYIRRLVRDNSFALNVGDPEKLVIPRYSAALALGDFAGAYGAMRAFNRTRVLRKGTYPFRLALSLDEIAPYKDVLFVSEGGVGDELRYSLIYPELVERLKRVSITVDRRLLTLFQRSYPMVDEFIPLPRYDRKRLNHKLIDEICDLPERDFAPFFNNKAWRVALQSEIVAPVVCMLADLRKAEEDFAPSLHVRLKPRPDLVEMWRERLAAYSDRLVVGLTWTSTMRQYQRIDNYLRHEEMEQVLSVPGVVFVNCQYDPVDEELLWARKSLGVEILDFPDLDKRDDFEGLAGLIANLDLFIGTGTTTTEFAALLGCPTIHASPSNTNAYRNPDNTERDHYFSNVTFVRPVPASNRATMMTRITELLHDASMAKATRKSLSIASPIHVVR